MSQSTETLLNGALLQHARRTSALWSEAKKSADKFELFDFSLCNTTQLHAASDLAERARLGQRTRVALINAHAVNVAAHDAAYARVISGADLVYADGSGLALAAKLAGESFADNVNGTDLFPLLCQASAKAGVTMYLLGGKPGVVEKAVETVKAMGYDGVIAGASHGYFKRSGAETRQIIGEINASGASILLVGMGVPDQDIWIAKNFAAINAPVAVGVGGLFDFFAGNVSRAPIFLRSLGCEWIWRLMQEPGRMWRRYLVGNVAFVLRALSYAAHKRVRPMATPAFVKEAALRRAIIERRMVMHWRPAIKRAIDILGALSAVILFLPVFIAAAIAIKLDSPGPILFTQTRVGQNGVPFTMLKFRSMHVGAEALHAKMQGVAASRRELRFKHSNDPRVTRVGRLIRRYSIDELPQFWNVLKGDMSLVGPRPALLSEVKNYTAADRDRLLVKPGITCTWQVAGRANIDFVDQVKLDRNYILRQSIALDLWLILRTPHTMLFGKGAY